MHLQRFTTRIARDFGLFALLGGVAAGALFGEVYGWSFAVGCMWLGLNFVLLGLVVDAWSPPKERGGLFKLVLACAKIPAVYLLLLWLFTREYLEPTGLVAGLAALPVVVVLRGLLEARESTVGDGMKIEEQA